jgi:hypothetical protein
MFKVNIDINSSESEIIFTKAINEIVLWIGKTTFLKEVVSISETGGVPDEKTLVLHPNVTSPEQIVYERFLNSYTKYSEELIAGFEPSEQDDEQNSLPQPYNPDDIKVRREGFSVFEVNRMMTDQGDIDLNPDFQRNLVWDNSRKSALIESILLGIPIPVFYFAESKSGTYHVVDGLQRLSTIKQFFNNEFALKKLEHLHEDCNGRYYKVPSEQKKMKGLDRKHSRRLENAQLIVNVIEYASPNKVKYDIFKRLNTGGRPLNKQEVRNCIATENVRIFLKECAGSKEFLTATANSVNDNRMDAQELVLRFVGFRLESEFKISYGGDMNSFLDEVLDIINDYDEAQLEKFKIEFLNGVSICHYLFGPYCFRKCLTEHLKDGARKQLINKALYLSWMMVTYSLNISIIQSRFLFQQFAYELAAELDENFEYYNVLTVATSDKQNLKEAFYFARNLLNKTGIL